MERKRDRALAAFEAVEQDDFACFKDRLEPAVVVDFAINGDGNAAGELGTQGGVVALQSGQELAQVGGVDL